MTIVLDAAWILARIFSYGGLAMILVGVGVFGWHFIRINAAAGRSESHDVPPESWRGPGAKRGYQILLAGAAIVIISIIMANLLPGRL